MMFWSSRTLSRASGHQRRRGVVREAGEAALSVLLEKGLGEQLRGHRADRRSSSGADLDHVDAVEELLPELALRGQVPEIAVARRTPARPRPPPRCRRLAGSAAPAARSGCTPRRAEPRSRRGTASPVGRLDEPELGPDRTGEAGLVAEELGLRRVLRQGERSPPRRRPRGAGLLRAPAERRAPSMPGPRRGCSASERAAFLTSSKTATMAELRRGCSSQASCSWSRRLRFSIWSWR